MTTYPERAKLEKFLILNFLEIIDLIGDDSKRILSIFADIRKELTLKDREWICKGCGTLLNRDVNAAINIKNFALRNILSGTDRKNQGKLPTLVGALTLEAHPIASGVGG